MRVWLIFRIRLHPYHSYVHSLPPTDPETPLTTGRNENTIINLDEILRKNIYNDLWQVGPTGHRIAFQNN